MARLEQPGIRFVVIDDFSPGIYDDYHAQSNGESDKGIIVQPGAATVENTFRCTADRGGALVPLPKLVAGKTQERLPVASNADARYIAGNRASFLLDGMVRNELFDFGENVSDDEDRAGVFVMYGQAYDVTDTADFRWTVIAQFHRLFEGDTSTEQHDIMFGQAGLAVTGLTGDDLPIGAGNFIPFRSRIDSPTNTPADVVVWVAYAGPGYSLGAGLWDNGDMSAAQQAVTDFDTMTGLALPGSHQRIIGAYPDPAGPGGEASGFLGGTHFGTADPTFNSVCHLVAHQGRMVGITRSTRAHGSKDTVEYGRIVEEVHYSPQQDFYGELGLGCFEVASWAEEKPYRTGAMASITADQLVLIKDKGGAIMARGDLNQPTIVQLPYVESTHGARCIPAMTPIGLIYGSANGVHLWEGGETSQLISTQIEGWFWNHAPDKNYLGNRGRMSWWNPWVCLPNNYLFDTRSKAWWRLGDPDDTNFAFNAYDVSEVSNKLYAFPYKIEDNETAQPMWYTADPDVLESAYTWQSHPIVESRQRVVTVQEIEIVATASFANVTTTIDVTLTGFNKDGTAVAPRTVTFTLSANTNTQMLHKDVIDVDDAELGHFQATHVQVRIQADSGSPDKAAPKIHSIKLTTSDRARVAKTRAAS